MSAAFDILEKVMLVYQVQATKSEEIPLIGQRKRPKKLLFLDVGLVNHRMGIQEEFINLKDLDDFYRGKIYKLSSVPFYLVPRILDVC